VDAVDTILFDDRDRSFREVQRVGMEFLPGRGEYGYDERDRGETAMPIHDWTRVDAGIFHDFHNAWITHLQETLNGGLLPSDVYAFEEPITNSGSEFRSEGDIGLLTEPPKVRFVAKAQSEYYVRRQRTMTIRHISDHRIIAMIEIVSAGNKSTSASLQTFVDKALAALYQGIHLLLIDLHPPGRRDPHGLHGAIWDELNGEGYVAPTDRPLTLAAYNAGEVKTAYVEPTAVGLPLLEMPLFITPEGYINVPLEATYQAAFAGVPRFYRNLLG